MIRFGICKRENLTLGNTQTSLGKRKSVAVSLYRAVAEEDGPEADRLLAHILDKFPTRNGVYKRTFGARFPAFDQAVLECVRQGVASGAVRAVHDIGVSDGRTSADLYRMLSGLDGYRFDFTASDYSPYVLEVTDDADTVVLILDEASRELLQIIRPPFVFNMTKPESAWLYPVNRWVRERLVRTRVPRLLERLDAGDPAVAVHEIPLLHPETLRLTRSDEPFRFERYDLLTPAPRCYDIVRAMNVLNRAYFSAQELARGVAMIFDSLTPGGLFITGSNTEANSELKGAVYRKTEHGFEEIYKASRGSEIGSVVTAHRSEPGVTT